MSEFADWSEDSGLPEPVLTGAFRTPEDSERIYMKHATSLLGKLTHGEAMSRETRELAKKLEAMTDAERRFWARNKFSWHKVAAAVDMRNYHYTSTQLQAICEWFRRACTKGPWEFLSHDVSNGSHLHLARRDFDWRTRYEAERLAAKGAVQ